MDKDRKLRGASSEEGPPTLPLPSAWRLLVAAIAILGVLYMMYETAREAEEASPPASSAPISAIG